MAQPPRAAAISPSVLSRRALLQRGGLALLGAPFLGLAGTTALAQTAPDDEAPTAPAKTPPAPAGALTPLNRFPRSVQEYYVQRVRAVEQAANARRAALRSKADAERYVAEVRAKIAQCFGPFPEKTPLNARVTAIHERDGYKIENVIFESRPGFPVTANLYVPTGRKQPLPGVVGACGHSDSGKAGGSYQMFAQGLARQGYVTLIFDPMGQGERTQYTDAQFKARFGVGTSEHTYSGIRMTLVGENLPTWFAWDGIRAIDYLLTRPEVDPKHIGVTGNSGGGTETTWLCGLDPRITMAAPSCFVTTLRRNMENEHSQDPEQWPWRVLELGLDHSDFIAAMAPKPVIIMGQEKDFFDARGFEEAAARLQNLYRLLGAEENFQFFLGADYHGFSKPNREAMYGWFNRQTGISQGHDEPKLTLDKNDVLRCTVSGQVAELKPATEFSITSELSRKFRATRPQLVGEALKQALTTALRMPAREGVPDYRILQPGQPRAYPKRTAAAYAVETEAGIHALVYRLSDAPLLSRVPRGPKRALLYVSHQSADLELREDTWVKELIAAEPRAAVFACDVRGVGESKPVLTTPGNPAKGGVDYFHAGFGLMLSQPMPGQRTHDLLRVIDWLRDSGHEEIHLAARGWGAIPSTFASVLHEGVVQVTLKQALGSYAEVAETERYQWPLSALMPGVLRVFDLPDCYRELERKSLRQISPVSAAGVAS